MTSTLPIQFDAAKLKNALPIFVLFEDQLESFDETQLGVGRAFLDNWCESEKFSGKRAQCLKIPNEKGEIVGFLFGLGKKDQPLALLGGALATQLEPGYYQLHCPKEDEQTLVFGFMLGAYKFQQYKSSPVDSAELCFDEGQEADFGSILDKSRAIYTTRDLINRPANDLGPNNLEMAIRDLAGQFGADVSAVIGEDLLEQNFPMIHAVGRAATEAPRLLEFNWGAQTDPAITLVGKGVTFDTGGLNLKPGGSMSLMKKDMGGAGNILGLAHLIMGAKLKVRLRVLIPIVENAIGSKAFRPGDILPSRKGLNVEIGNTDAEGRLILADALAFGDENSPELLMDMATLTGAARVAVGPELAPFYTHNKELTENLMGVAEEIDDPVWPMPLYARYDKLLHSRQADVNHISSGPFAGSITAALFLQRFVEKAKNWVHFDIYAWAPEQREGRPFGGTDQAIRAMFYHLDKKYGRQ